MLPGWAAGSDEHWGCWGNHTEISGRISRLPMETYSGWWHYIILFFKTSCKTDDSPIFCNYWALPRHWQFAQLPIKRNTAKLNNTKPSLRSPWECRPNSGWCSPRRAWWVEPTFWPWMTSSCMKVLASLMPPSLTSLVGLATPFHLNRCWFYFLTVFIYFVWVARCQS